MRWITREHVKVDRVACPWLIKKFVDPKAEFVFVPRDHVMSEAKRLDAIPYDVTDVELGHHGQECSFEAILKKYNLTGDPALVLLGKIVNGADDLQLRDPNQDNLLSLVSTKDPVDLELSQPLSAWGVLREATSCRARHHDALERSG